MARDLIPPSSPAGRPPPDGGASHLEGGTPHLIELPPEPPRSPAQPAQTPPPGPSQFRNRFGFLLGALAGVFIAAAIVVAVVASTSGGGADEGLEPNWSKWHPSDSSADGGAAQIAAHVGVEYRHPNGQQLVQVQAGPLGIDVMLRAATGNISVIEGTGVLYTLNGLGPKGSIKGGTPSEGRTKLIHREALELALYTFRYLPDVEMVVTLLPPPPPKEGEDAATAAAAPTIQNAIFYRPGDLKPQLQVPLGVTVPAKAPTADTLVGSEAKTIEALTLSNVFKWSLNQAQDSTPYLVLDR